MRILRVLGGVVAVSSAVNLVSSYTSMAEFQDRQQQALNTFRESLSDILQPCHNDYYLTRWIMANYTSDFDLKKSEADLRSHLQWRQQVGADKIMDWTAPEVLQKYYPGGLFGHDKKGRPIWIEPLGYSDVKGLMQSAKKSDIIRFKIQHCEMIQKDILEQRKKFGDSVDGLIVLFDLEHLGMHHLWKPAIDVYTEILTIHERHYPETLCKTYVVNAPRIFPIAYNIVKPFLSDATKKKIVILGKNWKSALREFIDEEELPVHWGGTATDPDGNPFCRSKVSMGGTVDRSYYMPAIDVVDRDSFTRIVIPKRSTTQIEFNVTVPESTLCWQFVSENMDVGFTITRRTAADDEELTIIPLSRLNCHLVPEDGSILCSEPGIYVVKFDNSYSWLHKKKVWYHIDVIEPASDLPPLISDT